MLSIEKNHTFIIFTSQKVYTCTRCGEGLKSRLRSGFKGDTLEPDGASGRIHSYEQEERMRERVAKKILKCRDKLNYTEQQIKQAEETLNTIAKRKEKAQIQTATQAEEKTE